MFSQCFRKRYVSKLNECNFIASGGRGQGRGAGQGQGGGGRGQGRGAGGGGAGRGGGTKPGSGPSGYCVCPNCNHKVPHVAGQRCIDQTCPKCGTRMIRE